ncbi:MAG: hypothetical protein QFF03_11495 [Pseudomonadota bacterium]|nr:hypothetical protein [Pseudomonadota bacterium]
MKARMADDGTVDAFYATAKMVPSFRKSYLILESSDYNAIDRQEIERFLAKLVWQGFDEWEFIGNWQTVSIA